MISGPYLLWLENYWRASPFGQRDRMVRYGRTEVVFGSSPSSNQGEHCNLAAHGDREVVPPEHLDALRGKVDILLALAY